MEQTRILELLQADEDALRSTLRANRSVDKSREACAETLREELGTLLLRYNAACANDRTRQAVADGLTATARDALDLLLAGEVEQETPRRRVNAWAVVLLLAALLCGAGAWLPVARQVVHACFVGTLLFGFLAGRFWFTAQKPGVRAVVDPEAAWFALKKTAETMDRKLDEIAAVEREQAGKGAAGASADPLSREELALFSDLLEALYAGSGPFALRQLAKIPAFLEKQGVELADYGDDTAEMFELLPSRNPAMTQRPALLAGDRLLVSGKATEQVN
ncbi:MAG: hypothetical protein IKO83_10165 [Oscillospiraceae bacterium]|nr:hypothetical protein [Oscillospiraceae bacterium]